MQDIQWGVKLIKPVRVPLGAPAVIAQKKDQCVVPLARRFQVCDHAANVLIHDVNRRCVDRHAPCQVGAPVGRKRVPCRVVFVGPSRSAG